MNTTAIVMPKAGVVELRELPLPEMTAEDILVETEISAVSVGTERWLYQGKRKEIEFPTIPGYMGIGRIVEVGANAAKRGYQTNQLVNFSNSRLPLGYHKTWMGAHLSRAVMTTDLPDWADGEFNAMCLEKVPENCDAETAIMSQLCAVAYRGIEMAQVPLGAKVLINGLGVIGLLALQICKLKGAVVAVADISPSRLKMAESLGADWSFNARAGEPGEWSATCTGGKGFDIIIDTSSIPAVCMKLFPALKLFGKFVFQGWYPPPSEFNCDLMHSRLPSCYFPCGMSSRAVRTAMTQMAAGQLNGKCLISHSFAPEQAPEVFKMIDENSVDFIGLVFDWRKK